MTGSVNCPDCGAEATGNFCASCGAALSVRHCTQCGQQLAAGSRFCTKCGTPTAASGPGTGTVPTPAGAAAGRSTTTARAGRGADSVTGAGQGEGNVGWWAAAGLMIVLIMVVAWPLLRPDQVGPETAGVTPGAAPTGAAAVDLSQMTPREAADRLFGRVMSAAETGDSTQAAQFMPMAIQAYQRAQPLDLDGLFHLSTLQRTSLDLAAALETAQQGLGTNEDHLLLLHAGAEAAREAGDIELSSQYYDRILSVYDAEMASGNVDYQAHSSMMTTIRQNAQAQLER